ncbi:MAG TPA: sulfurtransferase [Geminicoccaceae bacterium]|jgi:thiosulfate/3-mercaptopyruvate sulfurtransferase|nr:sulfurtransferase [Geminicoccaceae bacterium]
MGEDHHPEALVQTDWLEAHLSDPDLRVFECTTYLRYAEPGAGVPYHPEAGRADYEAGHIPGAGFLDLPGELSRQDAPVHFMMLPPLQLAQVMTRRGIGDGTRVVLYSRDRVMWATRVWWMLHAVGFDRAAVLDGGFEKWVAEGRPVSTEPCAYPPATSTPRPRPGLFVDKGAVLQALDAPGVCLINTLSEPDFRGNEPSRYGRPGHIPKSVNLPWPGLTDPETKTFIPLQEAAKRLGAIGADRAERIVCYCGGGISATMGLFLLHRLGYDNLALYDASMAEWARDESLPIARSAPRAQSRQ